LKNKQTKERILQPNSNVADNFISSMKLIGSSGGLKDMILFPVGTTTSKAQLFPSPI